MTDSRTVPQHVLEYLQSLPGWSNPDMQSRWLREYKRFSILPIIRGHNIDKVLSTWLTGSETKDERERRIGHTLDLLHDNSGMDSDDSSPVVAQTSVPADKESTSSGKRAEVQNTRSRRVRKIRDKKT